MSSWISLLFILLLLLLFILIFTLIIAFLKWRLRVLAISLKATESSIRRIHTVVKEREIVSFSLGLPVSRSQPILRLRLFELCRSFVHTLDNFSNYAVDHPKLFEERHRLMRVFYPSEMIELVESQVTEDSVHTTERGISTLIDLAILHRSELCRLLVLRFLHLTSIFEVALLLYRILILQFELGRIINQEKAFDLLRAKYDTVLYKTTPAVDHQIKGLDRVAVALNDIAMNIFDRRLSATDVQRSLRQVLDMDVFCEIKHKPNSDIHSPQETVTDYRPEYSKVDPVIVPIDQVFETIVSKDDEIEKYVLDVEPNTVTVDRSLMGELQHVLSSRAKLFAAREKKALAEFYGLSEEEMDRKLRLEENIRDITIANENMEKQVMSEMETVGCGDTGTYTPGLYDRQEVSVISNDLRAALMLRRLSKEEVLGDSDSDC